VVFSFAELGVPSLLVHIDLAHQARANELRENQIALQTGEGKTQSGKRGGIVTVVCFAQLCEGVAHFHSKNICHRDLTCENVMVEIGQNKNM
jgi:tRNA A-37 threonylcarbamoyl transferase component Bud32